LPVAADIVTSRGVEGDNEEGIGFSARLVVKEERSTLLIKEEEKGGVGLYTRLYLSISSYDPVCMATRKSRHGESGSIQKRGIYFSSIPGRISELVLM
jgi:hypothetical protein